MGLVAEVVYNIYLYTWGLKFIFTLPQYLLFFYKKFGNVKDMPNFIYLFVENQMTTYKSKIWFFYHKWYMNFSINVILNLLVHNRSIWSLASCFVKIFVKIVCLTNFKGVFSSKYNLSNTMSQSKTHVFDSTRLSILLDGPHMWNFNWRAYDMAVQKRKFYDLNELYFDNNIPLKSVMQFTSDQFNEGCAEMRQYGPN